ncbi:MAG: AAA family ATPase [Cyclobacteriaceae bacterium]
MRITGIKVQNVLPVKKFEVDGLSDTIVIAGPNGVGKSRLIQHLINHIQNLTVQPNISLVIEATDKAETEKWGKAIIDTNNPSDAATLKSALAQNRFKRNWESSIVYFESDRTIQKIDPFKFTWDLPDPNKEQVGWNSTFAGIKNRFQDTVHSIFKLIEFQKRNIANRAISLRKEGKTSMNLEFGDPLEPFRDAFKQLLAPKSLIEPSSQNQQLQYEYDGKEFNFNSLSSGEREVVNIVFDFILRKPKNCIVIFDEPEIHLHPELSFKMIQTLRSIGENNQFIFCTHSPDIISSSLDNSVIFLSPPNDDVNFNQAIKVAEEDETNQALRLLGHSIGIVALGKKIVLIEGKESSLDKQVYGSIIKGRFPGLVLVPTGGKDEIQSFTKIQDNVLNKSIWGVNFFLLTDHDSFPPFAELNKMRGQTHNFRTLKKYHLENYFLDENIWAKIFSEMETDDSWLTDPKLIKEELMNKAKELVSYTISLTVSSLLRTNVGNVDVMPKNCHAKTKEEVESLIIEKAKGEVMRVNSSLNEEAIHNAVKEISETINDSFQDERDDWKNIIPGRPILNHFASKAKLPIGRAKKLYINHALKENMNTFEDIINIFEIFDKD